VVGKFRGSAGGLLESPRVPFWAVNKALMRLASSRRRSRRQGDRTWPSGRSVRKKSFLRGCVFFNKRRSAIDCLIRDISDQGARIIFSGAVNVPDIVDLYIPQKEETVGARAQWRRGDEVGLAFRDTETVPASTPPQFIDLAQCVAELEVEMTAPWRTLKRLKREVPDGDTDAA